MRDVLAEIGQFLRRPGIESRAFLDEVKEYNEAHDVPVHPLYAKGYTSIGCTPCTRATQAGEDPRAGRWWWEKNAPKECGIHCPIETGAFEHEVDALVQLRPTGLHRVRA